VATVKQCRSALDGLARSLEEVDPELRTKHVPTRTVLCRVTDLEVTFTARLDPDGIHDIRQARQDAGADAEADVKLALESDELIALAAGEEDFLTAWLRGRVQVSASVRDMLRLRSLGGL
jgi:predicted lipid carrier protein YhbT